MSPRKLSTEMSTTLRSAGIFGPASTTPAVDALGAGDASMTDASCVASFDFRLHPDRPSAKAATQHHDTKIRPPCLPTSIVTFNPKTSTKTQGAHGLLQRGYGANLPRPDTFFLARSSSVP